MPRTSGRAAPSRATPAKATPRASTPPAGTNYPVIKDKAVIAAVEAYVIAKADESAAEAKAKALKAQIEGALGGAPTAYVGTHIVTVTTVEGIPATPNTIITKEMVGTVIPGKRARAGYTQLRVQ